MTGKHSIETFRYVGSSPALIPFPFPALKITKIIEKPYALLSLGSGRNMCVCVCVCVCMSTCVYTVLSL